jgi:hypoxanthine phosphoribosyltransferase
MNKLYLSNRDIEKGVHDIVSKMYADNWRPDYIVGITRGGLIPAVMMSHLTGIKMNTLDVRLRDGTNRGDNESNLWMAEDAFGYNNFQMGIGYEGKNILILDDINDTGATVQWIKEDWPSGCLPNDSHWDEVWHKNVRFATIVNNLASTFNIDYTSIEINKAEEDTWVVFPYEEWW